MVLKVPRLSFSVLTLCDKPFSILGFGDIVVPGFLVAYCHRFDMQIQSRQVYYMACTVAYAVGLLVTFVAMVLMQMGQPALLYLVSSTLFTSLAVATCRQELTLFWTGQGRAKIRAEPVPQPSIASAVGSERKLEGVDDSHITNRFEAAIDGESGDLDSNSGDDMAEMVSLSEDEATSPEGHSESSEGWSDANLDFDELASGSPMALEELMPLAMLIPLIPPIPHPSELGHIRTQSRVHDSSLPWMGLHKRKGLRVKRSMSTQAPL